MHGHFLAGPEGLAHQPHRAVGPTEAPGLGQGLAQLVRSSLGARVVDDADEIRFQRQCIANESETVQDIAAMRGDIDRRTALKLNPYIQPEEIDPLLAKEPGPC